MEVIITKFFNEAAPGDYSASVAERGDNAGKETWAAALEDANEYGLLKTEEELEALRTHAAGFGAWDAEEIASWSADECRALFTQMISGDIRETPNMDGGWNWEEYERLSAEGTAGGRMFKGDDGEIYYYLGE